MTAYQPTTFTDGQAPAIDAAFLNGFQSALVACSQSLPQYVASTSNATNDVNGVQINGPCLVYVITSSGVNGVWYDDGLPDTPRVQVSGAYMVDSANHAGMTFNFMRYGQKVFVSCYVNSNTQFSKSAFDGNDFIPASMCPANGFMEIPLFRNGQLAGTIVWTSTADNQWSLSSTALNNLWVSGFAIYQANN